jgi:hypothetical protein
VIERKGGGERLVIVANLSATPAAPPAAVAGAVDLIAGGSPGAMLRPWQTALYRMD